ncbi:MAG: hypothetical protein R3342_08160 [Lutibacter sp.]|uniref:hypothetical protein n=1 Tax=Lutibacter sp. TaxID=1925666 RepID=UPI00299E566F|nr:hypothetical protein [Lutibacter sp.]MDX1829504.1 hypothetical protein [Lutibacter sp.]
MILSFIYGFFILVLVLLIYLLFTPVLLFVDTSTNQYYVTIKGLAKASLEKHSEELIRIKLSIIFFKYYFYPLKSIKEKIIMKKKGNKKKKKQKLSFNKTVQLLKSFKVKKLLINLDTNDCITNAKLYPLFALLNNYVGTFSINFQGRNQMVLHIECKPIYIIKSFFNL